MIGPDIQEIAREFAPRLSSLAHRMIRNPAVAEEAAQESWVEVMKSLPGFQGRSKPSTWIFTIAKRTILRYAQKERTYSARHMGALLQGDDLLMPLNQEGGEREWVRAKCDRCLTAFFACLEPPARLAVLFHELVGLSYADLARVFGESETSVRQTVSRSRRRLKNYLARNCRFFRADADCRCRLRRYEKEIDRFREYAKLERTVRLGVFLKKTEKAFPRYPFWEKKLQEASR